MIKYTENVLLHTVELNPDITPIGSVILLHGLGADGYAFVSIVPELNLPNSLPLRFIFPHAPVRPVTINNGYVMRAWFDILGISFEAKIDEEGIKKSVALMNQWIQDEIKRGIPANKIILAGFSQGSVIALYTALQYPERLGGVLVLSGFLPAADNLFKTSSAANKDLPIFMGHGTQDNIVPLMLGQMSLQLLQKQGYNVAWHTYPMAHSVCHEEIQDIAAWLKNILIREK